jgi:hypothetical protein
MVAPLEAALCELIKARLQAETEVKEKFSIKATAASSTPNSESELLSDRMKISLGTLKYQVFSRQ